MNNDPIITNAHKDAQDGLFETAARQWLERGKDYWSPVYFQLYTEMLERDVIPVLGKTLIAEIKPAQVLALAKDILAWSDNDTARRYLHLVSSVWRFSRDHDQVEGKLNPCAGVHEELGLVGKRPFWDALPIGNKQTKTPINSQYEDFLRHVYETGVQKSDRTGTGTLSVFGHQMRFNLSDGLPVITTKKVFLKAIIVELLWFLRGDSNVKWLQENGCTIWDEWARADGSLGPVYGVQWRSWPTPGGGHIDQIQQVIDTLKNNPDSRRIIVSAWNVAELDQMALMPCHALFQFYVTPPQNPGDKPKLSCQLYQRSADLFLGVPFNLVSYCLLTYMVAQQCDMDVGDFIWTGGDCHIYSNHFEQVELQLSRAPMAFPTLNIKRRPASIFDYEYEDFEVLGYQHHPAIKAPVAV